MEDLARLNFATRTKAYLSLTKPGIIFGNVLTAAGGFGLAAQGTYPISLLVATLLGLALIIASACAFNNFIDRETDQKMTRTEMRPLARGILPPHHALLLGSVLGLLGFYLLLHYSTLLATLAALLGFAVYVFWYSFAKYRTMHGTVIGSIAGATPPVVGYCALIPHLDLGAWLLFALIALWQMPHFFAIAIYRLQDYSAASIPVLPAQKGIQRTQIEMTLYVIAFSLTCYLLTYFGYTGLPFALVMGTLNLAWLLLSFKGFSTSDSTRWARQMFLFSLIIVTLLCIALLLPSSS